MDDVFGKFGTMLTAGIPNAEMVVSAAKVLERFAGHPKIEPADQARAVCKIDEFCAAFDQATAALRGLRKKIVKANQR